MSMIKTHILKNGLKVVSVPSLTNNLVTILVLISVGSRYEDKETNGISHFLEHMLFKGTTKRPDYLSVAKILDKIGGECDAFTGEEYTGYYVKVESKNIDIAIDWASDIFFNSLIPEKEIIKEKEVILEEINMYSDTPSDHIAYLWKKLLYGNQPWGWPITGTKSSIKKFNRGDLLKFKNKHYNSSQVVVCVAGKFDEKKVLVKLERCFSNIKKGKDFKKNRVIDSQSSPRILVETDNTDQTHIYLGVRGYNLFHKDRYALQVLSALLGEMMSSRLFMLLRENLGFSYYVSSLIEMNPENGFLAVRAGIDNNDVHNAIKEILSEFKRLSSIKVSKEELERAKDYIRGKTIVNLESSDATASFYGIQSLLEKRITDREDFLKNIDKVTSDDILRVTKDIFVKDKLNLALIGPFKEVEFKELLDRF